MMIPMFRELVKTREEWLTELVYHLRVQFDYAGFPLPKKIRVSCSWPSKQAGGKNPRIGECWSDSNSDDKTHEVFISPLLDDAVEVADTLVHELCHCAVGIEIGHRGKFRNCATNIGLEGQMTATNAGKELREVLVELTDSIGKYPHAKLEHSTAEKKQNTRMLKVVCEECGCVCRMTRKWLDERGAPTCACGTSMAEEIKEGLEDA